MFYRKINLSGVVNVALHVTGNTANGNNSTTLPKFYPNKLQLQLYILEVKLKARKR